MKSSVGTKVDHKHLRTVPTFVSAHMFCASRKPWFKRTHAGVDIRDLKIPRRERLGRLPEVNILYRACV